MSQEHRRRSARRGSVWRTVTAIAGAAAMVTAMTALAPAASATKTYQVTVDKQWSGATQNDSTKIYIGQSSKTSTANSSGDHDSDVIQAYYTKDSSVNLKEELGFNGGRTYNASWTCTYKSGTTTKNF